MRHMVTIKTIDTISPIPGADRIEQVTIGGWNIVVGKGIHTPGESVLFFEIDSFLPKNNPLFTSFSTRGTKNATSPITGEDTEGHVLKTARLRGVYSQGAIMPLTVSNLRPESTQEEVDQWAADNGVFKYEPPIAAGNSSAIGSFPTVYARKTDAERVQNLTDVFISGLDAGKWQATEKIDGTSATFFVDEEGILRAASRNYEVSLDDPNSFHSRVINMCDMRTWMTEPGMVVQGEIYGEKIQGNPLKVQGVQFGVFHYRGFDTRPDIVKSILDTMMVPQLELTLPDTVSACVEQVNGLHSRINPKVNAEGVVWWNVDGDTFNELDGRSNFKAINNKYLLKHKDS